MKKKKKNHLLTISNRSNRVKSLFHIYYTLDAFHFSITDPSSTQHDATYELCELHSLPKCMYK